MAEMNQQERERLERQREADRRFLVRLLGSLAGLFALGLVAVVYVLASNGIGSSEGSDVQPTAPTATQASTTTGTQAAPTETQAAQAPAGPGRDQFASTCGGCHTLAAAGTTGTVGPNLDDLKPDQATVQAAIQNGPGVMPDNLLTGAQAQQVAAFVAASAGR
jgi:mono/diheme cytochrome c family protein